jgi:hypothetical protein
MPVSAGAYVPRHAGPWSVTLRPTARTFESIVRPSSLSAESGEKLIKTSKPGRDGTVRVTFALPVDEPGGAVSVVGSFNDWDPFAHPLRPRANNTRSAAVTVKAGSTLHFRYLAEGGVWFDDEDVAALEGGDVSITV